MLRVMVSIGLLSVPLLAAAPPQREAASGAAFEVASIRSATFPDESYFRGFAAGAGNCGLWRFTPTGNRVYLPNVTLCMLIRMAYDVTEFQIVGLPEWADQLNQSAWYQVEARAEAGTVLTLEQARERLQSLLADRFTLAFHRQSRVVPVYALTVDQQGHKLSSEPTGDCPNPKVSFRGGPGMLASCKPEMSISQLVIALNREVDRPVVDRTNLTGRYAFTLNWAQDPLAGGDSKPSIFTAVRDQLGLRLEPASEPVDVIVIDRVEPPSPN